MSLIGEGRAFKTLIPEYFPISPVQFICPAHIIRAEIKQNLHPGTPLRLPHPSNPCPFS